MRKQNVWKRPIAALLAMVLVLALTPAAAASSVVVCPECTVGTVTAAIVRRANCHEGGIVEYSCTNPSCNYYALNPTSPDSTNHDAVCTDNGNGTHSGVCTYHVPNIPIEREAHKYDASGKCEKCGAYNYSEVDMNLPDRTVPVALNDASAKLTAGDIKLTLGNADITKDYDINYAWYYQSSQVSTTAECSLPASVYGTEGIYYYTLYVMAVPKGTLSRQPVSKSCTITVQVENLITASAVITTEDTMLRMDGEDYWSAASISSQIYEAARSACGRLAEPSYVTFDVASRTGTSVGDLDVTSSTAAYSFSRTAACLDDVRFLAKGVAGTYTIGFTVTDTAHRKYAGVLTITVQQYVGSMDVVYIASRNENVTFSAEDFEAFWAEVNPTGVLDYISFNETPRSVDGALYAGYTSALLPGDHVRTSGLYHVQPGRNEYGIDEVTFVPGVSDSGYITLRFTAYGTRGTGYTSRREGTIYIFFNNVKQSADITVKTAVDGTALNPADFQKAYQSATGSAGTSFYIELLDVPVSGGLYTGRTATKTGIRLSKAAISSRPFSYNGANNETISSLTYVPGVAATESIRYVACSAQGKPLYAGTITFTTSTSGTLPSATNAGSRVSYTSTAAGVSFKAVDFENLPGANAAKLNIVSFTLPSAAFGTLYWGRTANFAGTPITSQDEWYSVSTAAVTNSVNNITFVPAAGYVGLVSIAFDALDNNGNRSTGAVQITVTSAVTPGGATTPGTATVPGTTTQTPGGTTTNLPVKTFKDVPQNEWYYTYVTDLTTSGVLSGYPDGSFQPGGTVKLGEALKMIMIAAGYAEQPATGEHWASGYLARAEADSLLPASLVRNLDRTISRYDIAEIASRAMHLPANAVAASPFTDMAATDSYAPYVVSLVNIGIITGDKDKAGQPIYNGKYAITRSQFAAIIWRIQNYVRTGHANGAPVSGQG